MDRTLLPYRKNCEGYFLYNHNLVLARDTGKGYVEFPGGGVDNGEDIQLSVIREAKEETGAVVGSVRQIDRLNFDWGPDWAKTAKQKIRYEQYRGEEMYFFIGRIITLDEPEGDLATGELGWVGDRLMSIEDTIKTIEGYKPFPKTMSQYHNFQIDTLKILRKLLDE